MKRFRHSICTRCSLETGKGNWCSLETGEKLVIGVESGEKVVNWCEKLVIGVPWRLVKSFKHSIGNRCSVETGEKF